jgi:hypothetical protein
MPSRRERAKMIEPNYIHVRHQRAQSVDAPTIITPTKYVPVVHGIAPQLSLRAEVIGRHSGDKTRPIPLVQLK